MPPEPPSPTPLPPPVVAPVPVGAIGDQTVEQGRTLTIDVSSYFRDPDGGALSYASESSDDGVAAADVSGTQLAVTGTGPGTATVTVTAVDPDGLTATQGFGVVVRGSFGDDFDSPASLADWETSHNADVAVGGGVLSLTNQTPDRLGIAERSSPPGLNDWTIQARMGRATRRASPGVVSLTRHSRFTAIRLVLRTLDAARRDEGDAAGTSHNYEFAIFDSHAQEWIRVTNMSGNSEAVDEEPAAFTEITLGHEGGDFVAYAGEEDELFRVDADNASFDGVILAEVVDDMTGVWLVNQGAVGLTSQHDWVRVTGTGSGAAATDGAGAADALDAATRSASVAIPGADALMALYRSAGGPGWTRSDNWGTLAPVGDWYGVVVDDRNRIVEIDLRGNNLVGEIAPELGDLASLRALILSGNELAGPVPAALASLGSLERLWLNDNGLTGAIPSALGALANLEQLRLYNNGLSGEIPPSLGGLGSLTALLLRGNGLTGPVPPELGGLANLERLWLDDNDLTGPIPSQLGGLASLQILLLSGNSLTGEIPSALGGMTSLQQLVLDDNDLTGEIPSELGGLANLQWLHINANGLTGEIPSALGALANLEQLRLYNNGLSGGIPPALGDLGSLKWLHLQGNRLSGEIPPELGDLASLEHLLLDANQLTGRIPPELGGITNLQWLWLHDNGLAGEVPPELGDLASLQTLLISDNGLTGRLPATFLSLSLGSFWWNNNAGLCAPATDAFRAWLAGIGAHRAGPHCDSDRDARLGALQFRDPGGRNARRH